MPKFYIQDSQLGEGSNPVFCPSKITTLVMLSFELHALQEH